MKKFALWILFGFGILILSFVLWGCGTTQRETGGGITHGIFNYFGTQSPGEAWIWTIGNSTFSASNEANGYKYSGSYTTLPSGFLKLKVESTTDPGLTPPVYAYAMELPNVALIVKPVSSESDNVIVCAAKGSAPTGTSYHNFITIPWKGWDVNTEAAYGTVEAIESGGSYTFTHTSCMLNGTLKETKTEAGYTFSDGVFSTTETTTKIAMTPAGVFIGDSGPGQGGFAGAAQQSITISDAFTKEYRGVLFRYWPATGSGETEPIGAEPNPGEPGKLRGFSYAPAAGGNIETGDRSSGGPTIEGFSTPIPGMIAGTFTEDNGSVEAFAMVVCKVSGKYIIFGISTTEADTVIPYNFLVVQK